MFDIGISKILIVGVIALIVIGPEKLPRVARMLGTLMGRARGYMAEVKAEVNKAIELEDLRKLKQHANNMANEMNASIQERVADLNTQIDSADDASTQRDDDPILIGSRERMTFRRRFPTYIHPRKSWRIKKSAVPKWYKRMKHMKTHAQSAAARLARNKFDRTL